METAPTTGQCFPYPPYTTSSEDEEEHDVLPFAKFLDNILVAIKIAIPVITVGLYFGLRYFNLGQYWPPLKWLEFTVPVLFLIASGIGFCCFRHWQNREEKKMIEEENAAEEKIINEEIPKVITDAIANSRKFMITLKGKATMAEIYLLVVMAKTGAIELGDGNGCLKRLNQSAKDEKWQGKCDRTVKIVLTDKFSRQGQETYNFKCLKERLTGVIEEIEVV